MAFHTSFIENKYFYYKSEIKFDLNDLDPDSVMSDTRFQDDF